MDKHSYPFLLALAFGGLSASQAMAEQRETVDDFSTGHFQSKAIKSGTENSSQAGNMLGGVRNTLLTQGANPYRQSASYGYVANTVQHGVNAFVQSAGFEAAPRIDQGYGPMQADLSSFDRVRVNFVGLSQPLNFNILMFTGAGRGQNGCNLPPLNRPFSIELPYSGFVMANGGFVPGDITDISLVYQSGSAIGAVEFGISSIEVSDTPAPGAIVCNFAGA